MPNVEAKPCAWKRFKKILHFNCSTRYWLSLIHILKDDKSLYLLPNPHILDNIWMETTDDTNEVSFFNFSTSSDSLK